MIESITIENFRGICEGRLSGLTPLTVLVGPNGSGKSAVLDALYIGANPDVGEAVAKCVARRRGVRLGLAWLFWRGSLSLQPTINVVSSVPVWNGAEEKLSRLVRMNAIKRDDGDFVEIEGSSSHQRTHTGKGDFQVTQRVDDEPKYGGTPNPLPQLEKVKLIDLNAPDTLTALHKLYANITKQGLRPNATEFLRTVVPTADILEVLTEGDFPILHVSYPDKSVPLALSGDGIHDSIRLALELLESDTKLALLEEPETHLHPKAIRQTAKVIVEAVRRGVQIVISTHSEELIAALLDEAGETDNDKVSLFATSLTDGCLKTSHLDGEDMQALLEAGFGLR